MGYISEMRKVVGSKPIIMAGACVIVINESNQILLQLRKDNDCWGLCGGALEMGETLEQAAKRELEEETGLIAKDLNLFDVFSGPSLYYQYPNGDEVYMVVSAYICRNYSGSLVEEKSEVAALQFFSIDELPSNISPPDLPVIEKFLD
ncbi:NUDIX hydrolase [Longirhabdus pacifica]|uniref:NUDIX hydrolase n=1 Tax=Longirhabdus pacifica TaxID=2305227 RepID=UPI0010088D1F|nr:NUDIX hydrolase [Longirhabdus pacifica]